MLSGFILLSTGLKFVYLRRIFWVECRNTHISGELWLVFYRKEVRYCEEMVSDPCINWNMYIRIYKGNII